MNTLRKPFVVASYIVAKKDMKPLHKPGQLPSFCVGSGPIAKSRFLIPRDEKRIY